MMKKIKLGLVGCGGFGDFHVRNLLQMEDAELIATASSKPNDGNPILKRVPVARGYLNFDDMLKNEKELDAIIVSVPPACHEDVEIKAAEHGIHIFVEKPVGLDLEDAETTNRAIIKSGIINCVDYQGRYNEYLDETKTYIDNHVTGMAAARFIGSRPGVAWWSDPTLSGGQIVEQATHMFDMLRFLFGEVHEVYSQKSNRADAECSISTLLFNSGVVASVTTGCYLDGKIGNGDVGFTVFTDDCRIEYDWSRAVTFSSQSGIVTKNFSLNCHYVSLQTFIQAIKTKDKSIIRSDYADGLKTLKATLAANQSLATGKPVLL